MAITIGEVEVEVSQTPAPQSSSAAKSRPQQPKLDLAGALERMHERKQRLEAD